jgi:integrase
MPVKKKSNGEGTIYKRADGRWEAQTYITLTDGRRKRACYPSADREKVSNWLDKTRMREKQSIPFAEQSWTVGAWLDHWLRHITVRPNTLNIYESMIRLHLKPRLGKIKLDKLSVRDVQAMVDRMADDKCGVRTIHKARQALSSALGKAMRQELIFRNVARLAELPAYKPSPKRIWNLEQARAFLQAASGNRWYLGYLLILTYGLRMGETLGLRWSDIDFERGMICIRQQIQKIKGKLLAADVKTGGSERSLPLAPHIQAALLEQAARKGIDLSRNEPRLGFSTDDLILTNQNRGPVDPHNFSRTFRRLIQEAGLPYATPHAGRHFAATLNKDIGTPLRDTQGMLGHASSEITRKIYQHSNSEIQRRAVTTIDELLHTNQGGCRQMLQASLLSGYEKDPGAGLLPLLKMVAPTGLEPVTQGSSDNPRPFFTPFSKRMTPIFQHLQAHATTRLLGAVAVKNCRQINRGKQIRRLCRLVLAG